MLLGSLDFDPYTVWFVWSFVSKAGPSHTRFTNVAFKRTTCRRSSKQEAKKEAADLLFASHSALRFPVSFSSKRWAQHFIRVLMMSSRISSHLSFAEGHVGFQSLFENRQDPWSFWYFLLSFWRGFSSKNKRPAGHAVAHLWAFKYSSSLRRWHGIWWLRSAPCRRRVARNGKRCWCLASGTTFWQRLVW